ncbi:MAG: hypothetical protein HYT78_10760 [Deltaproteobacteria bacterium]|nr:hypothetical protein [Deltaproteobacteria bacterium]
MTGGQAVRIKSVPASEYSSTVVYRVVATVLLTIWFALLGVELLEQAGLFEFPDQSVDQRVDAAVTSLGIAVQNSDEERPTAPPILPAVLHAASPSFPAPVLHRAGAGRLWRRDTCLYKLHRSLLL